MKAPSFSVIASVLLFGGLASAQETSQPVAEAKPGASTLDAKVLDDLSAAMQQQVDRGKVSGVVGLIARDGEIGYHEAFGKRVIEIDGATMGEDTLFRIFSMTKPIVAVTAMTLWEEGKFKLDDPISDYLPEWKGATVRVKDKQAVPAKTPITPRHLMTHSSGLSYAREGLKLGPGVTLEEFSQSLATRPLKFQPGTDYSYGYSIDVLGRYIEAIEGKPLNVVMRERVFDRIGMDDTEFWVADRADRSRVAMVYTRNRQDELKPALPIAAVMRQPSAMMGGQGLMSTSGDYAKFCQMLLNKGESKPGSDADTPRVLQAETVELMFQNHLKDIGKVYGLGGLVDGKGSYSWGGAAGTRFWVDSRSQGYAVFMIQTRGYKAPTFAVFQSLARKALSAPRN